MLGMNGVLFESDRGRDPLAITHKAKSLYSKEF